MKKLLFSLAFMLIGSFGFANTEVISDVDLDKIESLINVENIELSAQEAEFSSCGFTVYFDDGSNGDGAWGGSGSFYYSNNNCTWDDIFGMINTVFPGFTSMIIKF
jgi:hypothetical protein